MKSKDALLGDYWEMSEKNVLHKDEVFLEVLIDMRDALSAIAQRLSVRQHHAVSRKSHTRVVHFPRVVQPPLPASIPWIALPEHVRSPAPPTLLRARRMRLPPWLIAGLGAILLVGCATTEAELRPQTTAVLGYAPADVTLSNMRSNGINTFYRATTPQGQYACAAETGMAKVIALGLTSPPSCYKEATIDGGTDTK